MPASPDAYPCPTARIFQLPARRYTSMRTSAVSVVRSLGSNRAMGVPVRSLMVTDICRTVAKVWDRVPSRLAVTTSLSMSGGTWGRSRCSVVGDVSRTPGPVGWL